MKHTILFASLALIFSLWFSILTPADRFPDPDAFYHITMARLTAERGPVSQFPWLDLTTLGDHFADQHFLFHVLQIPFLSLGDTLFAESVSSITFAVICMLGIAFGFYRLRVKLFWLWPILLAFSQPLCTRLVQGKASPLAILLWFLGISLLLHNKGDHTTLPRNTKYLLIRQAGVIQNTKFKYLVMGFIGLLYSLTHGGWILLPLSLFIIILGSIIADKFLGNASFRTAIKNSPWQFFIASLAGIVLGLILHPGRKEILPLLWIQVVQIGIATPRILKLGTEWNTAVGGDIIGLFGVFLPILLLALVGLYLAPHSL